MIDLRELEPRARYELEKEPVGGYIPPYYQLFSPEVFLTLIQEYRRLKAALKQTYHGTQLKEGCNLCRAIIETEQVIKDE